MVAWFRQLDELLRGRRTRAEALAGGDIEVPLRAFAPLAVVLGVIYGFFMGWYAVLSREPTVWLQVVSSMLKLPALFLLTLLVTFPSLYVFNALVGCRLSFGATLRLLMAAIVVNLAVAASFGPILAFFTVSTTSYAFMVVLNVALLGVSGIVGMVFLLQTLRKLSGPGLPAAASSPESSPRESPAASAPPTAPPREPGPLDRPRLRYAPEALGAASFIFQIWVIIYALVGAQMGWLLRPFILAPHTPFVWLRGRQGDFFGAFVHQVAKLLGQ